MAYIQHFIVSILKQSHIYYNIIIKNIYIFSDFIITKNIKKVNILRYSMLNINKIKIKIKQKYYIIYINI